MKKNVILAVAAVLAVGQMAHAAGTGKGGKEGEASGAREAKTVVSKLDAVEAARKGPEAIKSFVTELKNSPAMSGRLSAAQESNLQVVVANAEGARAVNEAIKQTENAQTRELGSVRLEGLANAKVSKTEPTSMFKTSEQKQAAAAEQAHWNLVVFAGKQAEGWSNAELRGNMTFFLKTVNDVMASGSKTIAEAVAEAQLVIAKPVAEGGRAVRLSLEDINKFCKG